MKVPVRIYLAILGALTCLAFGIERFVTYERAGARAARYEGLAGAVAAADAIGEDRQALRAYREISPSIPEVELRILQKEWLVALDILHQVQLAKYNRVLEGEVPTLYADLEDHLDSMKDRCGHLLTTSEALRNEVAWRVYNIEGAARLLAAFTVMERERNWKKVASSMAAAIAAFKSAVESVDAAPVSRLEKNTPRWNLELLHEDIYIKKLMTVQTDEERLELRDNLEAVIPEKGGYAPGNPMDRRILK